MDREEYPILVVVALAVVGIGIGTTPKPLAQFFVDGTREFVTTTIATVSFAALYRLHRSGVAESGEGQQARAQTTD